MRGDPDAKLSIVLSIDGEDAKCLARVVAARGQKAGEVIADLLRGPDHHGLSRRSP